MDNYDEIARISIMELHFQNELKALELYVQIGGEKEKVRESIERIITDINLTKKDINRLF